MELAYVAFVGEQRRHWRQLLDRVFQILHALKQQLGAFLRRADPVLALRVELIVSSVQKAVERRLERATGL